MFKAGFWLFFLLIAISWLLILCPLFGLDLPFMRRLTVLHALTAFGISLAMACGLLWIGHQLGIINLGEEREKGIWVTLIVAVLSSVAAGITNAFVPLDERSVPTQEPDTTDRSPDAPEGT